MELYLDSADINEIEEAFKLGFLAGLTTTPTFMHRHGITDIDSMIVKLAEMVPVLQIEALGKTAQEMVDEAHRQNDLGLDKQKTVYKIPVSMEGVKACHTLRSEGYLVNIHLVYTLQQAYMAMAAGATYVCPLVGRLQDQGHDALDLVDQCVGAVETYGYDTKVMFSSVRYPEHVRNAINIGVHTITVPWKVMKNLTENNFTTLGTNQFFEHTKLMTVKVKDILSNKNPMVGAGDSVMDAIVKMTESGFGCVSVVNSDQSLKGAFTDGDLRRLIEKEGNDALKKSMGDLTFGNPITIEADALLNDAQAIFHNSSVDNIIVLNNGEVAGILDIQDLS